MNGVSDNKPMPSPKPGALNQPVRMPRQRTLLVAISLALLGAGAFAAWKYTASNPPSWMVRWQVHRYLKKEARTSNFKVENFDFPSKADMAKGTPKPADAPASSQSDRSGTDFEALREEYFALKSSALALEEDLARGIVELNAAIVELDLVTKQLAEAQSAAATNVVTLNSEVTSLRATVAKLQYKAGVRTKLAEKETALAPIVTKLWEIQRALRGEAEVVAASSAAKFASSRTQFSSDMGESFAKAASYADMYKLIGQELWVASRLLDSRNPDHIRAGMTIALSASRHALNEAQNGWVAARICEGYVLPHLDVANDTNRRSPFNPDNLLNECADFFRRNNEYNSVVRAYKASLAQAATPQRADSARAQIAMAYQQAGDLKQALHYIRTIQDTNDYRWIVRQATRLEQQLKAN